MGTLLKHMRKLLWNYSKKDQRLLLKRYSGSPVGGAPYFSAISTEDFSVTKHIYSSQFEEFKRVLGSCHGLVCLDNMTDEILLWNPSTGESKIIESGSIGGFIPNAAMRCFAGGLGYNHTSDDFKLIRFIYSFDKYDSETEAEPDLYAYTGRKTEVYSLKSNSWKYIDNPGYFVTRKPCAYEEGYGFWLGYGKTKTDHCIVAFNYCTDEISSHPLPRVSECFGGPLDLEFAYFEGSLCVIVFPKLGNEKTFSLWLHDGNSWIKEFEFSVAGGERPLGFWGRNLFLEGIDRGLMVYDINTGKMKKLDIYDYPGKMQLVPYVESDVSIKGLLGSCEELPDSEKRRLVNEDL